MARPFVDDDEMENLLTGDRSTLSDDEDELGQPAPVATIAGPQTNGQRVKDRISQIRSPLQSAPAPAQPQASNTSNFDLGARPENADPAQMQAALQFAKQSALTAGLGRAANTVAQGTGFKADDGAFDALEKQGQGAVSTAQTQAKNQSQIVKDWIANKAKQAEMGENRDFRQKLLGEQIASRRQLANDKNSNKVDHTSDKALTDTQTALEQARGSPAVQQAEKDVYASDKAKSLIKAFAPDGDLNKINNNGANLLYSEIGKIATGGVPSMHELEGLNPNTWSGALAKSWQSLSNSPTPANAGAFLKQYMAYADTVSGDAQKLITDRYGRVLNTRSRLLRPDDRQSLEDNYINRFKPKEPDHQDNKELGWPRQVRNAKTGKVATVSSPQEQAEAAAEGFQ